MFYSEGNYCYCIPDEIDGDFAFVAGREYPIHWDHLGNDYVTGISGQTYILKSL